jgi:hypothetical protein
MGLLQGDAGRAGEKGDGEKREGKRERRGGSCERIITVSTKLRSASTAWKSRVTA